MKRPEIVEIVNREMNNMRGDIICDYYPCRGGLYIYFKSWSIPHDHRYPKTTGIIGITFSFFDTPDRIVKRLQRYNVLYN